MDKLISQQAAIDEIFNEPLYESGMKRRYADVVIPAIYEKIKSLPSAQPEHMHTVMLKIAEKYEKAMNTSYILNPMAWALYQTWKEYDR